MGNLPEDSRLIYQKSGKSFESSFLVLLTQNRSEIEKSSSRIFPFSERGLKLSNRSAECSKKKLVIK